MIAPDEVVAETSWQRPTDASCVLVQNWLNSATRDLCADATTRIRAEVENHVNAACADWQAQGLSETSAFYKAFDLLGSPEAARARYIKVTLTGREQSVLGRVPFITKTVIWVHIFFMVIGIASLGFVSRDVGWKAILLVLGILIWSVSWVAFVQFSNRKPSPTGDKLRAAALSAFHLMVSLFFIFKAISGLNPFALGFAIGCGTWAVSFLRLAKKLGRSTTR